MVPLVRTPALTILLAALVSSAAPAQMSAAPAAPAKAAAKPEVLPFISDDYARAVAEAKARGVPIFIEAWAPW